MVAGALFPMHWDAEHRLVMIMCMQHVERAFLAVPPLAAWPAGADSPVLLARAAITAHTNAEPEPEPEPSAL
eukprot:scaffold25066_cov57-Phaeocystis_antarctica.AAC.4